MMEPDDAWCCVWCEVFEAGTDVCWSCGSWLGLVEVSAFMLRGTDGAGLLATSRFLSALEERRLRELSWATSSPVLVLRALTLP